MIDLKKITVLWGVLDICSISWFVGMHISRGEIPIYHDILSSIETGRLFGMITFTVIGTVISLSLYISLIFSGIYLVIQKKVGATLSYIQTPFRFLILIPPSIFFIQWPLKYVVNIQAQILVISTGIGLICLSEGLKLWTIILWRKNEISA